MSDPMEDEVGVDFPKDRMLVTQCSTDGPADEGVTLDTPTMEDTSASSGFLGPTEGFPTERKNSSSDLHSRLKTRKVLGVGEIRDDGDIYRSKISQILGHSEHLYVKLPKGLFYWQATNVAYFFGSGLLCLLLPQMAASFEMLYYPAESVSGDMVQWLYIPVRFYGSALIGISVLYRGLMVTRERAHIGSGLLGCSVFFGLQVLISLPLVWSHRRQLSGFQAFSFISKIVFGILGNYVYYEIASSSSSSSSTGMLRLLRRLGYSCGAQEYIGGSRTPAASASTYNIANAGPSQSDSVRQDVQKPNLENRQQGSLSTSSEVKVEKDKSL